MQRVLRLLSAVILLVPAMQLWAENLDRQAISAQELITASGVKGGLVVHVGKGDGAFTARLSANDRYVVQGLYGTRHNVDEAREFIKQRKLYGRVSVQHWNQDYLPYADNTVNLLVAEDLADVPTEEVMRVLVPLGVAYIASKALSEKSVVGPRASGFSSDKDGEAGDIGSIVDAAGCRQAENKPLEARPTFQTEPNKSWERIVKPWPKEIDEWTHFLHGPDNNAVAQDNIVGVPRHVQWIGGPKFARSHEQLASVSAMVSARGRLFTIVDEGLTADIRMPARWRLVARDAFNGVILWKRPIDEWFDHLHGFRSGPPDLPFRLVAVGDRVYVTLGLDKPVTARQSPRLVCGAFSNRFFPCNSRRTTPR